MTAAPLAIGLSALTSASWPVQTELHKRLWAWTVCDSAYNVDPLLHTASLPHCVGCGDDSVIHPQNKLTICH